MNKKTLKGMSLLEILIVVAVFSILGVIVTRSVLLTLRGSKKSESQVKVRENVSFSLGVIERQLRKVFTLPYEWKQTISCFLAIFFITVQFSQ